ncbi:hypothetical protein FNV43_RR09767 [Rhamnella rubrinervis]|uniref:Bifunctional inhibitor/plant lipid transfer protein/seed storage helical domain-containing protein n=1 Tax=Rhamnella rubrinervis TaxID=2594499 RepID=A0A8K0HBD9_9ROSA|nr:hypothetical protein FNV43_RR09767 [Rhamnella rubrinervis]
MEAPMKLVFALVLLLFASTAVLEKVEGATSPCGLATPEEEAFKLAPCVEAALDPNAVVSSSCCLLVKTIGQNPSCLCAIMLSGTARGAGINPQVAITIPKRCNIAAGPAGYKCGPHSVP